MEFNLSKIQEALEKSRKALLESMEIRSKTPLLDRTNDSSVYSKQALKFDKNRPNDKHVYFLEPGLQANDCAERDRFLTECSDYSNINTNTSINLLKFEEELLKLQEENSFLKEKSRFTPIPASNRPKAVKTSLDPPTPNKNLSKAKQNELHEIKNAVKNIGETTKSQISTINRKIEGILKENTQVPNSCTTSEIEKYKNLISILQKKLKTVTKKYKSLKKMEHSSCLRSQSKKNMRSEKSTTGRKIETQRKSSQIRLKPKRKPCKV